MKIVLCRVDERLIHGEIVNKWLTFFRPTHILIVDDELIHDEFMCLIYRALVPIWVKPQILSVKDAVEFLKNSSSEDSSVIVLAKTPVEFLKMAEEGTEFQTITLADKMYFPNKLKIPIEYEKAIQQLKERGISVVAQNAPEDSALEI